MNNAESATQTMVADYLRLRYPSVIFHSDSAAGIKLTMGQAVRVRRMQSGRAFPDLFVCEPRGGYHGLFIELKREGTRVYLRDGSLTADPHIREQAAVLGELRKRGYKAEFGIGFQACRDIIDGYLA